MKLYICLDYELSTPRYYSREMNFLAVSTEKELYKNVWSIFMDWERERKKPWLLSTGR